MSKEILTANETNEYSIVQKLIADAGSNIYVKGDMENIDLFAKWNNFCVLPDEFELPASNKDSVIFLMYQETEKAMSYYMLSYLDRQDVDVVIVSETLRQSELSEEFKNLYVIGELSKLADLVTASEELKSFIESREVSKIFSYGYFGLSTEIAKSLIRNYKGLDKRLQISGECLAINVQNNLSKLVEGTNIEVSMEEDFHKIADVIILAECDLSLIRQILDEGCKAKLIIACTDYPTGISQFFCNIKILEFNKAIGRMC